MPTLPPVSPRDGTLCLGAPGATFQTVMMVLKLDIMAHALNSGYGMAQAHAKDGFRDHPPVHVDRGWHKPSWNRHLAARLAWVVVCLGLGVEGKVYIPLLLSIHQASRVCHVPSLGGTGGRVGTKLVPPYYS